jgi:hypothetical protein
MLSGRRVRWVAAGLVAAILLAFGVVAFQPWAANHFGYALPGSDGLPWRIHHRGRSYSTLQVCAGAGWCESQRASQGGARCTTRAELERVHLWPLQPEGTIWTLLGPPHPLMTGGGAVGIPAPLIVPDGPDCYVVYGLEGGP